MKYLSEKLMSIDYPSLGLAEFRESCEITSVPFSEVRTILSTPVRINPRSAAQTLVQKVKKGATNLIVPAVRQCQFDIYSLSFI